MRKLLTSIKANASLLALIALLIFFPFFTSWTQATSTADDLKSKAEEISTLASSIRSYYANNIIARVIKAEGDVTLSERYRDIHGGIPIPATFAIEMGAIFDGAIQNKRVAYRFISDYPFKNRRAHKLDAFERNSLAEFRRDPSIAQLSQFENNFLKSSEYRLTSPILMKASCIQCHNAHPGSNKTDWAVGDVRGIQEVIVRSNSLAPISIPGAWSLTTGYTIVLAALGYYNFIKYKRRDDSRKNQISRLTARLDSEKKASEVASKRVEESKIYKYSIENSIVGVTICDMTQPDCPAVYVNEAFTKITGYGKEFAVGKNCRYLQGPQTDPETITSMRECIRTGKPFAGKLVNYKADGTMFLNQLTLTPIRNEQNTQIKYYLANQIELNFEQEGNE